MASVIPRTKDQLREHVNNIYHFDLSAAVDKNFPLKNGNILFLLNIKECKSPVVTTTATVHRFLLSEDAALSLDVVKGKVRKVQETIKNHSKNIFRSWSLIVDFLEKDFIAEGLSKKKVSTVLKTGLQLRDNTFSEKENACSGTGNDTTNGTTNLNDSRHCALNCTQRQDFVQYVRRLKDKVRNAAALVSHIKKSFDTKRVTQDKARKQALIKKYRHEKRELRQENLAFCKEIKTLKAVVAKLQSQAAISKTQSRNIVRKERRIDRLKQSNRKLHKLLDDSVKREEDLLRNIKALESRKLICQSKIYDANFRKCIYACLQNQVPVEKAGQLVDFILNELTPTSIARIPAPSTVAQMAYEMGIVSNVQLAEVLFTTPPEAVATLAWDATSIDGAHFNEINISVGGITYTLEVGKLSGGATTDYLQHITDSVSDLATLYSRYTGIQQQLVLHKFRELLNSTLTDRAPVNSCVTEELSKAFCKDLIKLNCNLHPLDGLATEAKKVLKNSDVTHNLNSGIYGQEGKAANLIHAVSKLRYKMNSGDPAILKSFLRKYNMKVGVIVRYVGNRLHILFHSAGIIIHLKDMLLMYLKKYCNDSPFRLSLIQDLEQPLIITQLRVLGLFGKLLTGPWMTLFYTNKDSNDHLGMVPAMQLCYGRLKEIALSPGFLLSWPTDCFDQALNSEDHVLRALRGVVVDEVFLEVTKSLAEGFCRVFERQLEPYLKGRLSVVTPQLRLMTSSAPLHNMHSERALGMFDSQSHRARNATVGYRDGKVKFALNKTMAWLETKSGEEQKMITTFARKCATLRRKHLMARERKILEAAQERLRLMAQRRENRERAKLEKDVQAGNQDCFLNLSAERKFLCDLILAGSQSLVGKTLHHIWADGSEDKVYQGVVSKMKGSNVFILYTSEAKPTKLSIYGLVADIIMGDASFID